MKKIEKNIYTRVDRSGRQTFYIRYKVAGRDVWERAGLNLTQARKALAVRRAEIAQGRFCIQDTRRKHSLDELCRLRLEYAEANGQGASYKSATKLIGELLEEVAAGRAVEDILPFDIEKLKAKLRERSYKVSYINWILALLKGMFNLAAKQGWIEKNPCQGVRPLAGEAKRERILSDEEVDRLLRVVRSRPERFGYLEPIIETALSTGMRLGEMLTLRWEQVDLSTRSIHLTKTKNRKGRVIPISSRLVHVLAALPKSGEYVLYEKHTDPSYSKPKVDLAAAMKLAGIADASWHTFRHTFISRAVAAGADLVALRDVVGHSDLRILSRYSHASQKARAVAVELASKREGGVNGASGKAAFEGASSIFSIS